MDRGNSRSSLLWLATSLNLISATGYLWVLANIRQNLDWVSNPENHARWFSLAWLIAELTRFVVPVLVTIFVAVKASRALIGAGFVISAAAGLPFIFVISLVESLFSGEHFDSLDAFWFESPDLGLNLMQIGDYLAIAAAIIGIVALYQGRPPAEPLETESIKVDDGR